MLGNKTENGVGNAQTFNKSSTTIEFDSPDDSEKAYNYELIFTNEKVDVPVTGLMNNNREAIILIVLLDFIAVIVIFRIIKFMEIL